MTHRPWDFAKDINHDGQFTVSDLWPMVKSAFCLPGDFVIYAGLHTSISKPLKLSEALYGGPISAFISGLVWLVVLLILLGIWGAVLAWRAERQYNRLKERL